MDFLKFSKLLFWTALVISVMSSGIGTAFINGLMGLNVSPDPYAGADLLAVSAVSAIIHIAGK